MDADGVAAELMWHFSQNGENLPWIGIGLGTVRRDQFELGAVAYDIYNRWLADFCATDPERLLGLVYIPTWDIDASIATLQWARQRGLRCVNFSAPGRPGVKEYNHLDWDPFWSVCTDLGFAPVDALERGPAVRLLRRPGDAADHRLRGRRLHVAPGGVDPDVRRGLRAASRPEAGDHRADRGLVRPDDARARLVRHLEQSQRPANAAERVRQAQRVPRRELHLTVAGAGRGQRGLRRQRAVGPRLPARRRRVPGDEGRRRGTDDQARVAARVLDGAARGGGEDAGRERDPGLRSRRAVSARWSRHASARRRSPSSRCHPSRCRRTTVWDSSGSRDRARSSPSALEHAERRKQRLART